MNNRKYVAGVLLVLLGIVIIIGMWAYLTCPGFSGCPGP